MNILFVVCTAGCICIFLMLASRYNARELEHKETLAALEKGVGLPSRQSAPWTPRVYLLRGMIWLFVGLASTLSMLAIAASSHRPLSEEEQRDKNMLRGYLMRRLHADNLARSTNATPEELQKLLPAPEEIQILLRETREEQGVPTGLGFLGLIPAGVGLAYLIFYRVESKKLLS